MKKPVAVLLSLFALLAMAAPAAAPAAPKAPPSFFGIVPQAMPTDRDAQYMRAGGIGSIRWPLLWSSIQPTATPVYDWSSFDQVVEVASRNGLSVLPLLYGTPVWLEAKTTTLPIADGLAKKSWKTFVASAVARYGPRGTFWIEHGPGSAMPLPKKPIRTWQVWNEANFYYFAFPASPQRYAKLLALTAPVIRAADPGAKVILSGLFGKPDKGGAKGMPAAEFLRQLYAVPGIKRHFDGVALHPYAYSLQLLKQMVKGIDGVVKANHDRPSLYITEIGWGSENNFKQVAFEQGPAGQAKQLKGAYSYLLAQRAKLNLRGVYWFTWRDIGDSCSFCDSAGFFGPGDGFAPKPAWKAFVGLAGGRISP